MPEQNTEVKEKKDEVVKKDGTLERIVGKVNDAENVLVALSDNPSVDEMAAAIGLTMVLDSIGKHATAIYSGKTPNVLEFLNPQETFETNTNSLQDFIIALNKEKADHLRYKVDGEFVKVYITPYRTTISEDDLEFSRGDFNVDLVIALNVAAATDLDGALREHGRIMHDASAINITTGAPGKFGEVEWIDAEASSISEMVTNLATRLTKDLDKAAATALMTGLVAATDRFSNEKTTPAAMVLAAKLMGAGADQQLIAENVSKKIIFNENEEAEKTEAESAESLEAPKAPEDKSKLDIDHTKREEEATEEAPKVTEVPEAVKAEDVVKAPEVPETPEVPPEIVPGKIISEPVTNSEVPEAPAAIPVTENLAVNSTVNSPFMGGASGLSLADQMVQQLSGAQGGVQNEGQIQPLTGAEQAAAALPKEEPKDYGKMIDEALAEPLPGEGGIQVGATGPNGPMTDVQDVDKVEPETANPAATVVPEVNSQPIVNNIPEMSFNQAGVEGEYLGGNPALAGTGEVEAGGMGLEGNPAEGGESYLVNTPEKVLEPVPNDLPMPGQEILPPPPTPPVDFSMSAPAQPEMPPVPEMPQVQVPVPEMSGNPEVMEVSNNPAVVQPDNVSNPGAFQIPNL